MHASIEQLIALRDSQPVAAEAAAHVRDCAECGQALLRLSAWRQRLRVQPALSAPEDGWARVAKRLERPDGAPRLRWLSAAGVALVASLVVAVVLVARHPPLPEKLAATSTPVAVMNAPLLAQLQAQSQYLENAVQSMNADSSPRIVNAGTAATVAALEDRIALIDYAINNTSTQPQSADQLTQLWQQRVNLMQSLAAVRYTQVSAVGWNP